MSKITSMLACLCLLAATLPAQAERTREGMPENGQDYNFCTSYGTGTWVSDPVASNCEYTRCYRRDELTEICRTYCTEDGERVLHIWDSFCDPTNNP
jgi:hypothetical protein